MSLMRKINQNAGGRKKYCKNLLFEKYKLQFRYFLNADTGGIPVGALYIQDKEVSEELASIKHSPMDSVSMYIAKKGNGKTLDIKNCYGCENNAIVLDADTRTVLIPVFFHGVLTGEIEEENEKSAAAIRLDIARAAAAACRKIEDEYPKVMGEFRKSIIREKLKLFIQGTNPKALENPVDWETGAVEDMLNTAKQNDYFIYAASKLKFILSMMDLPYNRVLIVIDGIESLDEKFRGKLVAQYLRFFECMRNYPANLECRRAYVNLLISMRPQTYDKLKMEKVFENYSDACCLYKKKRIKLAEYFQKKYSTIPEDVIKLDRERWDEARKILVLLSEKFDGKYANMIMRLADYDFRYILKIYESILSNPVWVTREALTDPSITEIKDGYVFNNITVIRSIACGSGLVYMGGNNSIIPNVFYNTPEGDNVLLSLYVMAYFFKLWDDSNREYCIKVKLEDMRRDFEDVFGRCIEREGDFAERFDMTIKYLISCRVLESTENELSISPKGIEIWKMLENDSVLAELYREDFYQEYDSKDADAFKSSYDLMQEKKQERIFAELLSLFWRFFEKEKKLVKAIKRRGAYSKYVSLFGNKTMTGHMLEGVCKSVDYSGKYKISNIQDQREQLWKEITDEMLVG